MRLVFIIGGAVATTGMLIISMWLNYLFGSGLGQTPTRAVVFGCVSVLIDAWKGIWADYSLHRVYTSDFELHLSSKLVLIHVAVR